MILRLHKVGFSSVGKRYESSDQSFFTFFKNVVHYLNTTLLDNRMVLHLCKAELLP